MWRASHSPLSDHNEQTDLEKGAGFSPFVWLSVCLSVSDRESESKSERVSKRAREQERETDSEVKKNAHSGLYGNVQEKDGWWGEFVCVRVCLYVCVRKHGGGAKMEESIMKGALSPACWTDCPTPNLHIEPPLCSWYLTETPELNPKHLCPHANKEKEKRQKKNLYVVEQAAYSILVTIAKYKLCIFHRTTFSTETTKPIGSYIGAARSIQLFIPRLIIYRGRVMCFPDVSLVK